MATKNLSEHKQHKLQNINQKKFGILVSEWNEEVTESLYAGCYQTLVEQGADREKMFREVMNYPWVPNGLPKWRI